VGASDPRTLPRTVNLITGPSRTGDIEQRIQLGAHGPRRLHVVLVEDAPPPKADHADDLDLWRRVARDIVPCPAAIPQRTAGVSPAMRPGRPRSKPLRQPRQVNHRHNRPRPRRRRSTISPVSIAPPPSA